MAQSDRIQLMGVEFFGYHGVYPEENKLGQRFRVDVDLYMDLRPAGVQDDLESTVNYAQLYETIKAIVEQRTFKLVEALAECIATVILDTYTKVNETTVRVVKPHPPFAARFEGVAVEIHRKRET